MKPCSRNICKYIWMWSQAVNNDKQDKRVNIKTYTCNTRKIDICCIWQTDGLLVQMSMVQALKILVLTSQLEKEGFVKWSSTATFKSLMQWWSSECWISCAMSGFNPQGQLGVLKFLWDTHIWSSRFTAGVTIVFHTLFWGNKLWPPSYKEQNLTKWVLSGA